MPYVAMVGAFVGAVIGAVIWAVISGATGVEVGYVAWAIGGLVGGGAALCGGRGPPVGDSIRHAANPAAAGCSRRGWNT